MWIWSPPLRPTRSYVSPGVRQHDRGKFQPKKPQGDCPSCSVVLRTSPKINLEINPARIVIKIQIRTPPAIQQLLALAASRFQHVQNRATIDASESFASPDSNALTKHPNDLKHFLRLNAQIARWLFRDDGERLFAGFAAIPLETVLHTEFKRQCLTPMTDHLTFPAG